MNVLLWVLQVLLALVFLAHGGLLLFPPAEIAVLMNAALPRGFWIFLGIAEILAAFGITLPGLTRVQPWLVALTAACLMFVMVCATGYHLMRGEYSSAATTVVLLAITTFVAYMRWRVAPIRARAVA
jgi:hypothetical protein